MIKSVKILETNMHPNTRRKGTFVHHVKVFFNDERETHVCIISQEHRIILSNYQIGIKVSSDDLAEIGKMFLKLPSFRIRNTFHPVSIEISEVEAIFPIGVGYYN